MSLRLSNTKANLQESYHKFTVIIPTYNCAVFLPESLEGVMAQTFQDFDIIILPGGPGTKNLRDSEEVIDLVKNQNSKGKYIVAICAAPTVLKKAGILTGKSVTSYPSEENVFTNASYFYKNVVVDGNIITSRAVGTALDFAIKLIELLVGKKKADEVAVKILYPVN